MTVKKILFSTLAGGLNALSYAAPGWAGSLAFRVFATPPPPRIRQKEADFLDTATRRDTRYGDHRIPVYQWGPAGGPLVFCAYGWGYNAGRWRHFVPELVGAGYRVVAFDPPGHGLAAGRQMEYPTMVAIERQLIGELGPVDLALGHSFGGGCLVEALARLPSHLRPRRICLMAVFSEVRWLFAGFADFLGLRETVYRGMERHVKNMSGRGLEEFDATRGAALLGDVPTLLVHDPEDPVTAFRNTRRNHSHWPGSWLYSPAGAGHHLGTPEVTANVLAWLIDGAVPAGAVQNTGQLVPLPTATERGDMETKGVTEFYQ